MKGINLFFLLLTFLQWTAIAQEDADFSNPKIVIKKLDNPNVTIRNAYRINTKNLEFSPTYYQNGIVYVTVYDQGKEIDKNIGTPFFELFYAELDADGMPGKPQPFSSKVNSSTHEGPTCFNANENIIYYTGNSDTQGSDGKKKLKIYEARRGNIDWENIIELPFNSNEYMTMHPTLSADGKLLYFASDMPGGFGGMDIYSVEKNGDYWAIPVNLGTKVNTTGNEAFPFIHQSGMLFFSSDGHGDAGGYDIFAIDTRSENPKDLIDLGPPFNSPNADLGFILNPEGRQGYFASSRYGGLGQDDIYIFDAPNGIFENAIIDNMPTTVMVFNGISGEAIADAGVYIFEKNKSGLFGGEALYDVILEPKEAGLDAIEVRFVMKKDLGKPDYYTDSQGLIAADLSPNKEYLFLVTKKGYANKKLHYTTKDKTTPLTIRIPLAAKNCLTLNGLVLNEKTGKALSDTKVTVRSDCDGGTQVLSTNSSGRFEHCVPFGCTYTLMAEKNGYQVENTSISATNTAQTSTRTTIRLKSTTKPNNAIGGDRLTEGTIIVLENIYYDFDKSAIRSGAAEELDALVALMQQYRSMEVELIAHTDARGVAEYNQQLSEARAFAARDYLFRNGIAAHRIKTIGRGESEIRNHCTNGVSCSDEEHQFNRRTEVKVTKLSENVEVQYSGN